jgi:hypothetical protein
MARELTAEQSMYLNDVFTYHAPSEAMQQDFVAIRRAARELAAEIISRCPSGADTSTAIRQVREAVMTANAAIILDGKNIPRQV